MTKNVMVPAAQDGWKDAAAEAGKRVIIGLLLLFSDWRWTIGKEHSPVPEGRLLAALDTAAGWVRWANGKPAEYYMRPPGGKLADRSELGYLDETQWEKGPGGEPQDPMRDSRFVYLCDANTSEMYTYTTSTFGGRGAVNDLAGTIERMRSVNPGAVPIVQLGAAEMPTRYGRKSRPVFRIDSWELGASEGVAQAAPATRRLASDTDFEGSDDVPFSE